MKEQTTMMLKTSLISATIVTALMSATAADAAKLRVREVPFYAETSPEVPVDVLRHGPLTLVFDCRAEIAFLGIFTAEEGMFLSTESPHMFSPSGTNGAAVLIGQPEVTENGERVGYVSPTGGNAASAIVPSGYVLTIPADSVAFGVHVARHPDVAGTPWVDAPDCFVTGTALLSRVPID